MIQLDLLPGAAAPVSTAVLSRAASSLLWIADADSIATGVETNAAASELREIGTQVHNSLERGDPILHIQLLSELEKGPVGLCPD